ncbi:MAG: LPXTG cell wall anchor domain-containing protein [Acidimicrobiales bacterium]
MRTDEVETAVQREQVRTTLAITGSSTATLAAFGSLLVGAGVAVLYGRRRHALSD